MNKNNHLDARNKKPPSRNEHGSHKVGASHFNQENVKKKAPVYVKQFIVRSPIPLLEFLLLNIKDQSRNNIKQLLSKKKVLVDGVVTTQFDYILQQKQKVQISKESILTQAPKDKKEKLDIIYEDDEIIVINKPSGLLSIATDKENDNTAYRMVTDYVRKTNKKNSVYVVHRIDRDTSGVLMFAKSPEIQNLFQDDWNNIVTERGYIAIVEGTFKEKQGTYESWLRETATHIVFSSDRKGDGKKSVTHYRVIKENRKYSMLDVKIDSGRKNQIRVQMQEHGHPVIGDEKYQSASNPLNRLGLHAGVLEFVHPITNKTMRFEAKTPPVFIKLFSK
jgi:23S rRNA pseudouridine1911/1915/1917 synthase